MRFAFVPIVILAASFTLAAAQTATVDPKFKIDPLKPPPVPADVNVLNFPDVQTVEGTVSVANLPAVQTVGGTVNVGNLPLDPDGAVRVTGAPTRQPVLVEVIPGGVTIESGTHYTSPSLNTSGYSWVGLLARGNWNGPEVEWRWNGAGVDDFGYISDARNGPMASSCTGLYNNNRVVCVVSGVEVRFHIYNSASVPVRLESIQLDLIP